MTGSETEPPTTFDELRSTTPSLDWIWLDGEFVRWDEARVHVLSHGLHYGTGVFEGVRCYTTDAGPAIFRWPSHLDRLLRSAAIYDLDVPYARDSLTAAAQELVRRQDLSDCYLRPIIFAGADRLGIDPTGLRTRVAIAAWPFGRYLGTDALETGIDVTVSSWRRIGGDQVPTTAKATGPYVNSVLATREAARNGYDEAVMLTADGQVAEGPGETLFLVRDDTLHTPALAHDVLPGVTRRTVVALARDLGYAVDSEATIGRGELLTADELFFAGTAAEVTPIRSVDGTPVGSGEPGPVTTALRDRFFDVVHGRIDGYANWRTPVSPPISRHP